MFIVKITVTNLFGHEHTYTIGGPKQRPIAWEEFHNAKLFTTRQKAKISTKIFSPLLMGEKKVQLLEVTPELEAEMLVAKLRGH